MDYKSQTGSELKVTGNFISTDESTLKLLVGDSASNFPLTNFQKAMIHENLNQFMTTSQKELVDSKRNYVAYSDEKCGYKILVFVAEDMFQEPVLFGDEKNYKSLLFDGCSKSWKESD